MSTEHPEHYHHHEPEGHWLELRVFAPREPEEHTFVFESTEHVGVAAEQVAKDFGYAPGNHTFQTREDDVLERGLTLQAAHVHDHQLLELVDVGGGVQIMVPASVTHAVVAAETPAVTAWAKRHQWTVTFAQDGTHLDAVTAHPVAKNLIVFHADLDGYPVVAPAWTCRDADGDITLATFPTPGQRAAVPGSIFHPNHVICAPWNRLAYGSHGGPHSDWADLTGWKTIGGGVTQAHTLADMLHALALHLAASPATAA